MAWRLCGRATGCAGCAGLPPALLNWRAIGSACVSKAEVRAHLAARRGALLQRSAELRERLALHGHALRPVAQWADRVQTGWRWLHAHPWVPVLAAIALAAYRPRRAWTWLLWAWRGWRGWRRWTALWARSVMGVRGPKSRWSA
ncbi:MAG: YqjK family protein [Tepidimonas sp.]|uniref:YqjK family protein n=1 Tax=Tepidimonas sp. TaxID=2002775 RepID=UPI004054C549